MNAVIYARYSSAAQTEQSIEGQLRVCHDYAARNGMTIVHEYIDRAISGTSDRRPEFQRMISDSENRKFQCVIVYKLDRFSRNRFDSLFYKRQLQKNGINVASATEGINGDPDSLLLEAILEADAERYSRVLSANVRRGMHESALKCQSTGGTIPLGYKVGPDKTFVIDDEFEPVARTAFERYANGDTIKNIVNDLNNSGRRNKKGKPFTEKSFQTMFKNRKYIGEYKYMDTVIEDGMPAIISKELFERVQIRMEKNKISPANAKANSPYLLSSKLFCGYCKQPMIGESGKSKSGKMYYYYKCSTRKSDKTACHKDTAKKDFIESLVLDVTHKYVLNDDSIDRIADLVIAEQKKQYEDNSVLLSLEQSERETRAKRDNIVSAIEKGAYSETLNQRLTDLETELKDLHDSIFTEKNKKPLLSKDAVVMLLQKFKVNIEDKDKLQKVIDAFLYFAALYDDKLVLVYNYNSDEAEMCIEDINKISDQFEMTGEICSDYSVMVGHQGLEPRTDRL